jgi:cytochrome c peroxidase
MASHRMRRAACGAALWGAALLAACGGAGTSVSDPSLNSADWAWALPRQFPLPKVPADRPMSRDKVALGRHLFYDVRLSGNGTQACGSCHQQDKAFTDGRTVAVGSTGQLHPRNTQSIVNVVYNTTLTWANPSQVELERQARVPIFGTNPVEMGVTEANQDEVLARIAADPAYPPMFAAAFPGEIEPLQWSTVFQAIAAFQRSIISAGSRYDRWLAGEPVLDAAELRGMTLFSSEKAECFHCHTGFNFNDQVQHAASRFAPTPFHNTGLYNIDGQGGFPAPNRGLFEIDPTVPSNMGKFRAPSLRNVAVTAPYMHDGSIATLEEVLDFYIGRGRLITDGPLAGDGRTNPFRSDLIGRITLSAAEKADLIAFLRSLTDEGVLTDPRFADPFAAASAPSHAAHAAPAALPGAVAPATGGAP